MDMEQFVNKNHFHYQKKVRYDPLQYVLDKWGYFSFPPAFIQKESFA
ncbi:protein of unknown function [Nitrospina watsonii]|uniref:Uncharacterized protein n=1 Tax=Nitrospina watsonii TaxID=1323948 RepID=A0ABM9HAF3_9BACT|nr:protein of unknown function [Nitrospina watsonii]